MVKQLLDIILRKRAVKLVSRIKPWMPALGSVLDIGAATGHNTIELAKNPGLAVSGLDVVDIRWGDSPLVVYDGITMPFGDNSMDAACVIYILQYVPDPAAFLREARRITRGNLVVIQTLYKGRLGKAVMPVYEYFAGILPLRICKLLGIIRPAMLSMHPRQQFTAATLKQKIRESGNHILHEQNLGGWLLHDQLYVLTAHEA